MHNVLRSTFLAVCQGLQETIGLPGDVSETALRLMNQSGEEHVKAYAVDQLVDLALLTPIEKYAKQARFWATIYRILAKEVVLFGGIPVIVELVVPDQDDPFANLNESTSTGIENRPELPMRPLRTIEPGVDFFISADDGVVDADGNPFDADLLLGGSH